MEGTSIVILKEEVKQFRGKEIVKVSGNSKVDYHRLLHQKIVDFKSWGKHFIISFTNFSVRIHFLMFGSYRVNERKPTAARLSLKFKTGELNFYTCSVKIIDEPLDSIYDWQADIMSDHWNPRKALKSLKQLENSMICDALLEQQLFAGSGNIIKNEVLWRVRVHPETKIKALPDRQLKDIVQSIREYAFEFY